VKVIYLLRCIADEYLDNTTLELTMQPWLTIQRPNGSSLASLLAHIHTVYINTRLSLPQPDERLCSIPETFDRLLSTTSSPEEQAYHATITDRTYYQIFIAKLQAFRGPVYDMPTINYMSTRSSQG